MCGLVEKWVQAFAGTTYDKVTSRLVEGLKRIIAAMTQDALAGRLAAAEPGKLANPDLPKSLPDDLHSRVQHFGWDRYGKGLRGL
jgi:hypothetical protein